MAEEKVLEEWNCAIRDTVRIHIKECVFIKDPTCFSRPPGIPDGGGLQKHLGSLINKYVCLYYTMQVFLVVLHFHAQSQCVTKVWTHI